MHWKARPEHFQMLDMHALHHVLQCSADFQSHLQLKLLNSVHQQVKIQQSYTTNRIYSCMAELRKQSFTAGKNLQLTETFFFFFFLIHRSWRDLNAPPSSLWYMHQTKERVVLHWLTFNLKHSLSYCLWQPPCGSSLLTYCSNAASPTAEHTEVTLDKQIHSLFRSHWQIFNSSSVEEKYTPLVSTHLFVGWRGVIIRLAEIACGLMQEIYWNRLDW